jgi:glycosyltransferase involved in cell wall biosynthesis
MKIKILHITHAHGGIKTFIENIVDFSDSAKFENYVLGPEVVKNYGKHFKKKFDVSIVREPHPVRDFIALINIVRIILIIKPHIIHCHCAKGGFLGRIASKITRTKCVYTPNAFSYLGFHGIKKKLFVFLEKITKNFSNIFLAVSFSEASRAELEIGYQKRKIITIQNSIEVKKNDFLPMNIPLHKIGMIGRLIYQKNPLMFLKVALLVHKDFPNVQFELLGAGYQDFLSQEVEYFIKKNKMEQYCSVSSWDSNLSGVNEFYNSLSVFVLTSNFEGLPYSLLEAMAQGIPCVATDSDGNRDVIRSGDNGFIVPCNDAVSMAREINQLLCDEALYKKISLKGYQTVFENFNIEKNILQYEDVYLNLFKQLN